MGVGIALTVTLTAFADKKAQGEPLPLDELRIFSAIFGTIKQDYVEPVADKKLLEGALKGMVASLDPHSSYLDQNAYKDLINETQGEFGGIGIEIIPEEGLIKIVSPIEDTPAYKAGIKNGDLIVKIDDTQVQGMSAIEAVSKMRGAPNTTVTLTILRKNESRPLTFTLRRAIITVQSVKSRLLEPNYGYIRIAQFQEHTTADVVNAIKQLAKENKQVPLKGLLIDLRNDPGGLIQAAVGVPAIFLPKDTLIVYTQGRTETAQAKLYAAAKYYVSHDRLKAVQSEAEYEAKAEKKDPLQSLPSWVKDIPLVILVNSGSASASEIVAGALQDHKRALIVGTQTFGKGSVQTVIPIDGGKAGLRLTTAHYFTPNGRSIQAKGITPDIVVEEALLNKEAIHNPFQIREADLENHLTNPTTQLEKPPTSTGKFNAPDSATDARTRQLIARDYQLQQGLNILKIQLLLANKKVKATESTVKQDSTPSSLKKRET
jgi:carboxyl-terminal processing protease